MRSQLNVKIKQMKSVIIMHVHQQFKKIHYQCHFQIDSNLILPLENTNVKRVTKRFPTQSHLSVHKRQHSMQEPFACDQCLKSFFSNFHCDVCPKKFAQSFSLTYHRRIHSRERPYQCDLCDKKFTLQGDLKRHKRIPIVTFVK